MIFYRLKSGHFFNEKCIVVSDVVMMLLVPAKRVYIRKLPKLHKRPYKACFIANSSSCTTTSLSQVLTSCLTAIKNHWIKYCEKTYEREGINYFWSIKNSTEILDKLKTKGFQASTISTYDFSTVYTTLPHNLIRNQLVDLIEKNI